MKGKFICHELFEDRKPVNVFHQEEDGTVVKSPEEKLKDKHILFRKKFSLAKTKDAMLKITADDYFKLYINGKFVTQGPPPSYPQAYYYMEIPVENFLVKGENVIAVHTLYQGLINRVWVSGDERECLWAELTFGEETVLSTDESWLCRIHSGYAPVGIAGYDTQFLESYDSRAEEVGFYLKDFDDGEWARAKIKKFADYVLIPSPIKPLDVYYAEPVSAKRTERGVIYDFGQEAAGYIEIAAEGKSGDVITIRQGEELNEDGSVRYELRANCVYEEKWTLSGKEDLLDQFDYKAFRYAELILPENARIVSVKFKIRHYPFCDNSKLYEVGELQKVVELCKNTIKYGTQEVIADCYTREKGQYLGDFCVSGRAQAILTGDAAFVKKCVLDFCRSAFITEGLMSVSTSSYMQEIADYGLIFPAFVLWIYKTDGDASFLNQIEPYIYGQYEYFSAFKNRSGLLEGLKTQWNLVDWPDNFRDGYDFPLTKPVGDGIHNVINALWIGFLISVNEIERLCGKPPVENVSSVTDAFYRAFYDERTGLFCDNESKTHSAVHSNIFPLLFGVCRKDDLKQRIVDLISRKGVTSVGVYMAYFMLAALVKNGETELARKMLLEDGAWLNMIKEDATTTFEVWGKDKKWNTSLFHPWAVAPIIILSENTEVY